MSKMTTDRRYEENYLLQRTPKEDIIQMGSLQKMKNKKLRYFVLRAASTSSRARLECYHSEKKFRDGNKPTRSILVSEIFSVDKTKDPEYHFAFTIFVKDEKYGLIAKFPDDRDAWIEAFNFVKKQDQSDAATSEFVWNIRIKDEGLGKDPLLQGDCRLKKKGNSILILKKHLDDVKELFFLANVKSSGFSDSFLFLEIGRSHSIGPGELWIEALDSRTAEDMHTVIFGCNLTRPKSCVSADRSKFMSDNMTNRRRKSDGADKAKLRKRGTLFTFLKSKPKDGEVNRQLKSKRSHSAADIQRLCVNQDGDHEKLKLLQQRSAPLSNSVCDVRRDSTSSKKSTKKSFFRSRKHETSSSAQETNSVDVEVRSTLPRDNRVSVLKLQYERNVSRSAQNINSIGRNSPTLSERSYSSRTENLRNLSMMHASSTSNIPDNTSRRRKIGVTADRSHSKENVRPVTMAMDHLENGYKSAFRKSKWRSFESETREDSPAVSSAECSSIGSVGSNISVESTEAGNGLRSVGQSISDEGYVRMNYNCTEEKPYANLNTSDRDSVYMLMRPDVENSNEDDFEVDGQESYMEMTPKSLDIDSFGHYRESAAKDENQNDAIETKNDYLRGFRSVRNQYEEIDLEEARISDSRPVPLPPPKPSRHSCSSSEGSVFASGSWEDSTKQPDNPIPLPPRTRREQSSHEISTSESPSDRENPVPLPPKAYRRLSAQSSVSDEERAHRSSPSIDRHLVSSDSESQMAHPQRPNRKDLDQNSPCDEEKLVRSANIIGRPLPSLPRGLDPKNTENNTFPNFNDIDRITSLSSATSHCEPKEDVKGTPLYSVVDKKHKALVAQNSAPMSSNYDRQSSQTKSEGDVSPQRSRHQFPSSGKENATPTRTERSFSELASPFEDGVFSPTTPEKKSKGLFKDIGKRMTVNFRHNKKSTLSPKKRMSEATSHFYVDTCPVISTRNCPDANVQTLADNRDPRPSEEVFKSVNDASTNIANKQQNISVRPNYLELNSGVQKKLECCHLPKQNIYTTVDENGTCDDNIVPECVRNVTSPVYQQKTSHIQQEPTRSARSYETVYTEVTLKERTSPSMPLKGIKSLTRDKKKSKVKVGSEAEGPIEEEIDLDWSETGRNQEPHRRISQKILSSPTRDGNGYENISLRDGIITTPLDEVEGRPYMNLGFHKNKGKATAENRRSADEAAMKLLMGLQNGKKMGDELSVRRKSNADIQKGKESADLEPEDMQEAAYVNIGKDRQLVDSAGCSISQGIVDRRNRRTSEQMNEEESAYQNISVVPQSKRDQNPPAADLLSGRKDADIRSRAKLSTPSNNRAEGLYSNIGFHNAEISPPVVKNRERPIAKPRPKKPERRKISLEPTTLPKASLSNEETTSAYDEVSFSPKQGYLTNGIPNLNLGIPESSYVNVGSYDDFDVGRCSDVHKPMSKSQSYENLAEDFPPRRNRKKSVEFGLAYADVQLRDKIKEDGSSGRGHVGELSNHPAFVPARNDENSPTAVKKNSPKTNSPRSKTRCAYTEIDFMKSHGISEAVRERRVESFEGESERD